MGSTGLGQHSLTVRIDSVLAQGVAEFGGENGSSAQGDKDVVIAAHEAHRAQQRGHGHRVDSRAPRGGPDPQVDGAGAVGAGALLGSGDDRSRTLESATQRNGFADEEAQADGVFRVELGEASGVRAGQGQRRQRRGVCGDVLVEA